MFLTAIRSTLCKSVWPFIVWYYDITLWTRLIKARNLCIFSKDLILNHDVFNFAIFNYDKFKSLTKLINHVLNNTVIILVAIANCQASLSLITREREQATRKCMNLCTNIYLRLIEVYHAREITCYAFCAKLKMKCCYQCRIERQWESFGHLL